jgi:hypothetical protein
MPWGEYGKRLVLCLEKEDSNTIRNIKVYV